MRMSLQYGAHCRVARFSQSSTRLAAQHGQEFWIFRANAEVQIALAEPHIEQDRPAVRGPNGIPVSAKLGQDAPGRAHCVLFGKAKRDPLLPSPWILRERFPSDRDKTFQMGDPQRTPRSGTLERQIDFGGFIGVLMEFGDRAEGSDIPAALPFSKVVLKRLREVCHG
ncbi:MAG: hypothetical protein AAGI13_11275 [Pseudomonadota bacterium]